MSLIHVDAIVVNHYAPPPLVQSGGDERAPAELPAGGAGEQPPELPPNHFGDPSEWDDEEQEDRAVDLACAIVSDTHRAEAIRRRASARFDALHDLVGPARAREYLEIARECAEASDDPESPFNEWAR